MYIQMLQREYIEINGEQRALNPGDVADIGKQTALMWISQNRARFLEAADYTQYSGDAGIVTDRPDLLCQAVRQMKLPISPRHPQLLHQRTVIMDSMLAVRPELIGIGLGLLDQWEIAVPMQDYDKLAIHAGTPEVREKTKAVIRDLRVPLYDTRLLFVRKTNDTTKLIQLWQRGDYTDLAFLQALYTVKPFLLALPMTWTAAMRLANA